MHDYEDACRDPATVLGKQQPAREIEAPSALPLPLSRACIAPPQQSRDANAAKCEDAECWDGQAAQLAPTSGCSISAANLVPAGAHAQAEAQLGTQPTLPSTAPRRARSGSARRQALLTRRAPRSLSSEMPALPDPALTVERHRSTMEARSMPEIEHSSDKMQQEQLEVYEMALAEAQQRVLVQDDEAAEVADMQRQVSLAQAAAYQQTQADLRELQQSLQVGRSACVYTTRPQCVCRHLHAGRAAQI